MVATGLLVAAYLLQADINRHRRNSSTRLLKDEDKRNYGDEAFLIIGIIGVGAWQARGFTVCSKIRVS